MKRQLALYAPVLAALVAFAPLAAFADPPMKTAPSFPPGTSTPTYPKASRKAKEAGVVKANICIDHTGHVTRSDISQSSGHPNLDAAVVDWLRTVKLNPATENGKAVDVCDYPFSYEFKVTQKPQKPFTNQDGFPGDIAGVSNN
jgi:TonB family protein